MGCDRFDRYVDSEEKDSILDEGIEQFYTELGVDTQVCFVCFSACLFACLLACLCVLFVLSCDFFFFSSLLLLSFVHLDTNPVTMNSIPSIG